jgi:holo-[acyl-carrier protein] synthase
MNNISTGIDIIEIDRIKAVLSKYGERFLKKIYTQQEIDYCNNRPANLAGRFAAKEATMKALGTGTRGVSWKDIEVIRAESGAPSIKLYERALKRYDKLGCTDLALSFSHSRDYAIASVIVTTKFINK